MADYIIQTKNLSKSFVDVLALDNMTLVVKPGVFGLVGPNGAGKTTLIRILLGLAKPTSGEASVLGQDVVHNSYEIRERIGVLHERATFPKAMKVRAYLDRVCRMYEDRRTSEELLEMVGLAYAGERPIGKLSAGMHQRLGLAQAFAGNPELVILDEPTVNLDVKGRRETIDLVVEMYRSTGVSFFISSHILSELERACDSIAFMKNGRVLDSGSIADILSRYAQGVWRVRTSMPEAFASRAGAIKGVRSARVTGSTLVTVTAEREWTEDLQDHLRNLSMTENLGVHAIEPSMSLEDAYEVVMDNE
ncbi:MAG: ABC transporter ATP-binding protein [Candidatus Thorarchaeota archaeon]|nr:ABC transporter ATP-binding protein [Candidatus Thorarchaeota archaeon]